MEMQKILKEIQAGKFAKEWMDENKKGRPKFNKYRQDSEKHEIEKVGSQLRKMMSWMKDR
jgi:ketol-acid reductoisomerase